MRKRMLYMPLILSILFACSTQQAASNVSTSESIASSLPDISNSEILSSSLSDPSDSMVSSQELQHHVVEFISETEEGRLYEYTTFLMENKYRRIGQVTLKVLLPKDWYFDGLVMDNNEPNADGRVAGGIDSCYVVAPGEALEDVFDRLKYNPSGLSDELESGPYYQANGKEGYYIYFLYRPEGPSYQYHYLIWLNDEIVVQVAFSSLQYPMGDTKIDVDSILGSLELLSSSDTGS